MNKPKATDLRKPGKLIELINGRNVFIWGARHDGYAVRLALTRHGILPTGYIDSSPSLAGSSAFGLSITDPANFFAREIPEASFIIVASGFFADEIVERCEEEGWQRDKDLAV